MARGFAREMAIPLGRPLPAASSNQPGQRSGDGSKDSSAEKRLASPLFGFAPGGACHAAHVAMRAVRSYRTVSPLPCGGLFSVALSLGLPPPEVIRHRVSVEPGLSSTAKAVAIRPAGPIHIGAWGDFVNYRIGNPHVIQIGEYPALDIKDRSLYYPFTSMEGSIMVRSKRPKPVHQMTIAQFEATFPHEAACKT